MTFFALFLLHRWPPPNLSVCDCLVMAFEWQVCCIWSQLVPCAIGGVSEREQHCGPAFFLNVLENVRWKRGEIIVKTCRLQTHRELTGNALQTDSQMQPSCAVQRDLEYRQGPRTDFFILNAVLPVSKHFIIENQPYLTYHLLLSVHIMLHMHTYIYMYTHMILCILHYRSVASADFAL